MKYIGKILFYIKNCGIRCLLFIFRLFPIRNNKVLFSSFFGTRCDDSPLYIAKKLQELEPNLSLVWIADKTESVPKGMKYVANGSVYSLYELATSRIWVDNSRKPIWTSKRKKQFYIQTWHGGVGLKRVEGDALDKLTIPYIQKAKHDSKLADLFISECKWRSEQYRRAFWYTGEIMECGLPRSDILISGDRKKYGEMVKGYYKINENARLLLYAPTFRANYKIDNNEMDYDKVLSCLRNKYGGEWYILVRFHPNVMKKIDAHIYGDHILNGSLWEDANSLLITTDILVTDYSSILFDAIRCNIPAIMYALDLDEYVQKERGINFKIDMLPSTLARSMEELIDAISNFDYALYLRHVEEFTKSLGYFGNGNASEEVARRIISMTSE